MSGRAVLGEASGHPQRAGYQRAGLWHPSPHHRASYEPQPPRGPAQGGWQAQAPRFSLAGFSPSSPAGPAQRRCEGSRWLAPGYFSRWDSSRGSRSPSCASKPRSDTCLPPEGCCCQMLVTQTSQQPPPPHPPDRDCALHAFRA